MNSNNVMIHELIIEGFKSYGSITKFSDFDEKFNSITGINGSGKSNVLDSICFVLGLTDLSIIRVSKIQDLIFRNEKNENNFASVTLILHNKKTKNNFLNLKNLKQFTITRKIMNTGVNKYVLNQEIANPSKILNFLFSINININNPHFFVRQGHIIKIVNMKPEQLLGIVENAFGTKLYDLKKKFAIEIIQKKEEKVKKIGEILKTKIKPHLNLVEKFLFFLQKLEIFKIKNSKWNNIFSLMNLFSRKFHTYANRPRTNLLYFLFLEKSNLFFLRKRLILKIQNKKNHIFEKLKKPTLQFKQCFRKKTTQAFLDVILTYFTLKKNSKNLNSKKKNIFSFKKKKTKHEIKFIHFLGKHINLRKKNNTKNSKNKTLFRFKKKFFILLKVTGYLLFFFYFTFKKVWFIFLLKIYSGKNFLVNFIFFKKNFKKKKFHYLMAKKNGYYKFNKSNNFYIIKKFFKLKNWKNITNQKSFFLDPFLPKNKKNLWNQRLTIYGSLASLIKVKKSYLTTSIEFSGFGQLSNVLVHNSAFIKKIIEQVILLKKITLMPLTEIYFHHRFLGENYSFSRALACLSYDTIFSKSLNFIFGEINVVENINRAKTLAFSENRKIKCITLNGEIFDPTGSIIAGKNNECGFCFLNFFSESNNEKAWWSRFAAIRFKCEKKKIPIIFKIPNKKIFFNDVTNRIFNKNISKKNNRIFLFLLNIFLKKTKKMSEKIYLKIIRQNFLLNHFLLVFFPKNFPPKKNNRLHENRYKIRKFYRKKKEYFFKTLNFLCFQLKKESKLICKINLEFFLKERKLLNSLLFEKMITLLLRVNLLIGNQNSKKTRQLLLFNFNKFLMKKICFDFIKKKFKLNQSKKNISENKKITQIKLYQNFDSLLEISKHYFLVIHKKLKIHSDLQLENQYEFKKLDQMNYLIKGSDYYKELLQKRALIEKDKLIIKEIILKLDKKKAKIINQAIKKVNSAFQAIFAILLPNCFAKLVIVLAKHNITKGIDFRIILGQNQTQTIQELSGGQKSILALSFMFSLLLNKPAPFYILDEIDAALDICHTQNIGKLIMLYFPMSQFIIVSLKNGIISNAKVIFKIRILQGKSCVIRLQNK